MYNPFEFGVDPQASALYRAEEAAFGGGEYDQALSFDEAQRWLDRAVESKAWEVSRIGTGHYPSPGRYVVLVVDMEMAAGQARAGLAWKKGDELPDRQGPPYGRVRASPEALRPWVMVHEACHLAVHPSAEKHGAAFASTYVLVATELFGQRAGQSLVTEMLRRRVRIGEWGQ